jgi:pSer/pThr/pTyr-binding forkhead associated (FHA) protein
MVREHAAEERWAFVGPVTVVLEQHDDIDTGLFRIRSQVTEGVIEEGPPQVNVRGRPRLVVTQSPGASTNQLVLSHNAVVLGRGSDADLRLTDPGVSRRHAEVRREGDDVVLVDLGSTNGTQVNGRNIERVRLTPGDQIALGGTTLVYQRDEA